MHLLYKSLLPKILFFFCFFSYFYQIHYKYIPGNFACLLGILGIGYYLIKKIVSNKNRYCRLIINKSSWKIFVIVFVFFSTTALSVVLNSTSDFYFQKLCILNVLYFFAAYFLMILAKKIYGKVSIELLIKYLVLTAFTQIILSFSMFFNPDLQDMLNKPLTFSSLTLESVNRTTGSRLMGFGTAFFQSGIIHGYILILLATVTGQQRLPFIKTFGVICSFILISLGGLMLARTVAIGILFSFILYLGYFIKNIDTCMKSIWKIIISFIIIAGGICITLLMLPLDIQLQIFTLLDFALELINNYFMSGSVETRSTDVMFDMYIFPSSIKTWLLGDAYWDNPKIEGHYYMGTDIGYCRMLFYFGLLGLFFFVIFQSIFIYQTYLRNKRFGVFPFILLFLYVLILNLKGFADLFYLIIPCYFFSKYSKPKKSN